MCLACVDPAGEGTGCHCDVSSRPAAVFFYSPVGFGLAGVHPVHVMLLLG